MTKMILGFLFVFVLVLACIQGFAAATGRERIQLIYSLGYSMLITVVVVSIIAAIVILF